MQSLHRYVAHSGTDRIKFVMVYEADSILGFGRTGSRGNFGVQKRDSEAPMLPPFAYTPPMQMSCIQFFWDAYIGLCCGGSHRLTLKSTCSRANQIFEATIDVGSGQGMDQ